MGSITAGMELGLLFAVGMGSGANFHQLVSATLFLTVILESALDHVDQRQWFRLHKGLGLAGYLVSPVGAPKILIGHSLAHAADSGAGAARAPLFQFRWPTQQPLPQVAGLGRLPASDTRHQRQIQLETAC